ncbi:MFS transporter [Oscillospiraceae bacterium MB08-C2-2]|nr:MFS transporter [Oscillospiraceae bacterium MB08-C2-2]
MKTNEKNDWKAVVALLCLGWVMIWIYRTMLTPVYDEIQAAIGQYSNLQIGMISSMYFFAYVLAQIPGGILMDRVGQKAVLVPGFLLFFAGIVVTGLASNLHTIFVGSVLAGIGTGTYYSGAFSLSGERVPPQHKFFATALINSGCAVGMIAGYLSGGILVKRLGIHWRYMVFAAAAGVLLVALLFVFGLKRNGGSQRQEKSAQKVSVRTFFSPKLLAAYFLYFSTCYGYYMIVTWLPSFLETERGMRGSTASIYACVVAAVSIPGALLLGKLLDRFSHKRVPMMFFLQLASGVMLLLLTKFTSVFLLLLCLALYGLCGKQAIDPLIVPHVSGKIPDCVRSTGLGIFNFFGMSGSVFAPGITGYVQDQMGSKVYGFYIAAVLLAVSALLFYIGDKKASEQTEKVEYK